MSGVSDKAMSASMASSSPPHFEKMPRILAGYVQGPRITSHGVEINELRCEVLRL